MSELLALLAAGATGLLGGSLLFEGAVLVPLWRALPAERFHALHPAMGPKLFAYFAPLTTAAVALPVLNAALVPTPLALAAALLMLTVLAIFFLYFKAANRRFAEGSLSPEALARALKRWQQVHWLRTVLALAGFACALLALAQ